MEKLLFISGRVLDWLTYHNYDLILRRFWISSNLVLRRFWISYDLVLEKFWISSGKVLNFSTSHNLDLIIIFTNIFYNNVQILKYDELIVDDLRSELKIFKIANSFSTIEEVISYFMNVKTVKLFPNIVNLLKLIIVRPISSVSCERGFSTLRRVKTWLRNNMTSNRLKSVIG